ncbi:MAG: 16S rRNA (uracil(1498)-N(3))-methyltransferase [Eubacteriales bacterium]|nr:16S rRNA (uracil(1498)-N(3))-methyltransferase [Eubacteriales bacterium]
MHHFFVKSEDVFEGRVILRDDNYNHAVNVLRLRSGEKIVVSGEDGTDMYCTVETADTGLKELCLVIDEISEDNHELPAHVTLYQSLPKSDKMELIIQKATELGVTDIVPVVSKNCVMKLEPKKEESKIKRWQAIAEAAAKQSKRSVIPTVHKPLSFTEAVKRAEAESNVTLIPYEDENGMTGLCESIISFLPGSDIAAFIGPEGGYDRLEVQFAMNHGIKPVSLGKRILRTETAAIAILSLIMIRLEIVDSQKEFE